METGEIEYRYVRGKGWVAGYKELQPFDKERMRSILEKLTRHEAIIRPRWYGDVTRR